ncbi:MAG: hypothetical protein FK734_14955 [Asgard group archaeon]|nr:hypothetical protein [Asgard group archaeon]
MPTREKNEVKLSFVVKVKQEQGQELLEKLKTEGLFDNTRKITSEGEYLWIPVKEKIENAEIKELPQKKKKQQRLVDRYGIKSYDIIGDVIVIFLPERLYEEKQEIGEFLLKKYPRVKAVYREVAESDSELRIQEKELIAGKGSETIHREHGLKFKLDITKVFFSPRQVTERLEVIEHVKPGERVCVFFSGIAPIPIYLSKFTQASQIFGIEINPIAHKYGLENLKLNEVENVILIQGDVQEIAPELAREELFDLIIIPAPKGESSFIDVAYKALTDEGRVIVYAIGTEEEALKQQEEVINNRFIIESMTRGNEIAPEVWRYNIYAKKK